MSKMTLKQWRDRLTDPLPLLPIELKDLAKAIDAELKWQADVSGAGQGRKFRKKPVVIEASQWYQSGDHDAVQPMPDVDSLRDWQCSQCGHHLARHGRVLTLEGDHIVCPGDWIITGVAGEHYPCKPGIFDATYERVEDTR